MLFWAVILLQKHAKKNNKKRTLYLVIFIVDLA